jgi:mono/diheme cytochrome c family protein
VPRVIGTIAFVLAFIGIGLTVVFVAMSSGRRRSGRRDRSESPEARRAWTIGLTAVALLIGVGLPLWILIVNSDSHAKQVSGGIELTDAQVHGREVFALRCANCHTLAASNAVGRVGPNLDQLASRVPKLEPLVLDAIKNGRARGQGQMPVGVVDGQDAKDVASYVNRVAGRANQ